MTEENAEAAKIALRQQPVCKACSGRERGDTELGFSGLAFLSWLPLSFSSLLISFCLVSRLESGGDNIALNPSIFCLAWLSSKLLGQGVYYYVWVQCLA